jgi:uncharacterized protein YndB with AHSA1/START domain
MGEYEQTTTMRAPPERVFDFVSDIRNMPSYLPTTKSAEPQGGDRVRVQGEAQGHSYDSDGYLRPDPQRKRLEWGADEGYYSGWLQVQGTGAGASTVTVHISLRGHPPGADPSGAPSDEQINEGLVKGLRSIQNHVEGRGGKEEPSAATGGGGASGPSPSDDSPKPHGDKMENAIRGAAHAPPRENG